MENYIEHALYNHSKVPQMDGKICPRCNANIPEGAKQCPECKKNLEGKELDIEDTREVEETLEMVDGETFEIKSGESDVLIEKIKKIGSSKDSKKEEIEVRDPKDTEDVEEVVVYECPVCESTVREDDEQCPDCGAIFEE